jgi:outer membrane protein assembly factor BamB
MARFTAFLSSAVLALALAAPVSLGRASAALPTTLPARAPWPLFGYDAARHNAAPSSGITARNVRTLSRRQVALDGTADSSPILAGGLVVLTTSYGKTIALDARTLRKRWEFTPPGYSSWAGSYRITNSSPASDGRSVWAAAPNGRVYRLALATGHVLWSTAVTRLPEREKLGTALNLAGGRLYVTTGGYIGDQPPYQGHVVALSPASGRILAVFNSLCSERGTLQDPATCPGSDSAIWARSGAVVDPATGDVLVATGNGPFDGRRFWGDSVLELSPGLVRVASWTPPNQAQLNAGDVDLGSTAPAILPGRLALQSGKDGLMRVLTLPALRLVQTLPTPDGAGLFSAPAVWGRWVFVGTGRATAGYRVVGRSLRKAWANTTAGTSPVVAGGLLYVYDPNGGLNVYVPATGRLLAHLDAGGGHWSSPIVSGGRVYLPEGDANDHATSGVLDVWSVR